MTVLADIAYGISKGFWKAYFEELEKRNTATDEVPDSTDAATTDAMRAAVRRADVAGSVLAATPPGRAPGSADRPSGGK